MLSFRFPDKPTRIDSSFVLGIRENEWLCQGKYDGWRCQIYQDNGQLNFFSRIGNNLPSKTKFPQQIVDTVKALNLPDGTVLDSEFVGPRGRTPPQLYLFDCLALEGQWLVKQHFIERWKTVNRLYELIRNNSHVCLAETVECDFLNYFEKLRQQWLDNRDFKLFEGVVIKRKTGSLILNRSSCAKSIHMFKLKYRENDEGKKY
jgi:ATP-dependent DNA ligase